MKSTLLFACFLLTGLLSKAQKVDSIFFHLYTDSLKKGTYNYINVDGKLSNGRWLPLTGKEITFSASTGKFDGNSLFIGPDFTGEKVTVKAVLKENPTLTKETTIYIKKKESGEQLPSPEEVVRPQHRQAPGRRHNR
jgi:hypothetical protein